MILTFFKRVCPLNFNSCMSKSLYAQLPGKAPYCLQINARCRAVESGLNKRFVQNDAASGFKPKLNLRDCMFGVGLGIAVGGILIYKDYEKGKLREQSSDEQQISFVDHVLKETPPQVIPARSIFNPKDTSGLKLTLYQYQTCPFCCKVRAFLDYYGFSYDVIEVNSVTRQQVKWSNYKKVPFLLVEVPGREYGESTIFQLKDSSLIVSALSSILRNPEERIETIVRSFPESVDVVTGKRELCNKYFVMYGDEHISKPRAVKQEREWRQWVDDQFVHVLSPNVYRTPREALQAFTWFSETGDWERLFPTWERLLVVYVGAAAMWLIGKRLKKRHSISKDPRDTLYLQANWWMYGVAKSSGKFMGGEAPNLADLNMYGVLTAIEGCQAFQDMLEHSNIAEWFYEMKESVNNKLGEQELVRRGKIN